MEIISGQRHHRVLFGGATVLALAGVLSAAPAGALAAAQAHGADAARAADAVTSFTVNGFFNGVTATSASNAWAVGGNNGITLIAHWNGTGWKQVPARTVQTGPTSLKAWRRPPPATPGLSATTQRINGGNQRTLIAHWNGTSWK